MCGRYALRTSTPQLARVLGVEAIPNESVGQRSYNIAPTQAIATCHADAHGKRQLSAMRWGLIPSWSKGDSAKFNMINARAETITEKPAYRTPFKYRRCLIPVDGFYEWRRNNGEKQPYFIRLRSNEPFTFAGIWEKWKSGPGETVTSCAIITTDANAALSPIHHRMPVIIAPQIYADWLDPKQTDPQQLVAMLTQYDSEAMEAYPVSTYVNKAANDDELCWQPLAHD